MAVQDAHRSIVRLIGHPRVSVDGAEHDVPAGSGRLLAFVALQRIRLERCYVAGTLWPACDDVRAIGDLRSALWRLRCAGINVILADKRSLILDPAVDVDVHLVAAWAGRLISGCPEEDDLEISHGQLTDPCGATAIVEACELLSAWDDEWAVLDRERLRQRVLHALEAAVRLLARDGRTGEAIRTATAVVAIDPLRESAQRSLVEAHLAAGDRHSAVSAYASFRDIARRELGLSPSRRLTELLTQSAELIIRVSTADGPMPASVPSCT